MSGPSTRSARRERGDGIAEPEAAQPPPAPAPDPRVAAMLSMQQGAGNAAVTRMLAERRLQRSMLDDAGEAIGDAAEAGAGLASDAAEAVTGMVGGAVSAVTAAVEDAASSAWDALGAAGQAAWAGITNAAVFVAKWGLPVLDGFGEWAYDLVAEAPSRVWSVLTHLGSGIVGTLDWLSRGLNGVLGAASSALSGALSWLGAGKEGLFAWVWDGLGRGEAWAARVLSGDFEALREGFAGALAFLGEGFKALVGWGWEGVQAAGMWIGGGVAGVAGWIVDGLKGGAAWAVRLVTKCLDLIGFGELLDLLGVVLRGATRGLTPGETVEVHKVFLDNIDYGQVRIYENSLLADFGAWLYAYDTMAVTTFHTINTNRPIAFAPKSWDAGWLVHELTHVWQYERFGGQYLVEAAWAQATAGYDYGADDDWRNAANGTALADKRAAGATLASFNREQQGAIVQHYYMRSSNDLEHSAWDPYIDDLRSGVG